MHNSKLFDIISKFDKNRINQLNQYLNLYRIKKENAVIRLFNHIYSNFTQLESAKFEKSAVHKLLFPDKEYDEKRVVNAMSDLLALTEAFIAYQASSEDDIRNKFHLLRFYLEHDLNKQFESKFAELKIQIEHSPEDMSLLIYKYQLEMLHITYQLKYNKRSSNYQNSYTALNNLVYSQQKKMDNLFIINLYNDIDKTIINSKLAKLHTELNKLLQSSDFNEENYILFKMKCLDDLPRLSIEESVSIIVIMINICIDRINAKDTVFNAELLYWYDYLIERDNILELNGTISSAIVKNYITICLRLNKANDAEYFLEKFADYLDPAEKEDVYNYNKANILFYKQEYDEAQAYLTTVKFKDIFYKLSVKRMYIKIYFCMVRQNKNKYVEVLDSSLNAFKKYIYTTKEITETVRNRNKSFYKYISKLTNIHYSDKPKLQHLKSEILHDTSCADRDWLIEII